MSVHVYGKLISAGEHFKSNKSNNFCSCGEVLCHLPGKVSGLFDNGLFENFTLGKKLPYACTLISQVWFCSDLNLVNKRASTSHQ